MVALATLVVFSVVCILACSSGFWAMAYGFNEDALRTLRADYWTEIRSLAKDYMAEPEDTREDWLWQTCDGHQWVIYTYAAQIVRVCTDNEGAYESEMGERGTDEQVAMFAMMADVGQTARRGHTCEAMP